MVFLKVTDGNETRRFQVTSELTFDQLRERLIKLFPSLGQEKDLVLKYRDADGDLITLSSNEELQEVLAHTPDDAVWKLHIKTSVQEPSLFDHLSEPFWRPFGLFSWGGFDQELREAEELFRQRRRQCGRARTAAQAQKKATDSRGKHGTSAEPTEGNTPSNAVPDDEAVKSKTSSGDHVLEHKPQWHCKVIGSWEPRIYEGLFGHRTVIGPVGYHLWWGNSDTGNKREDPKKEAAPEQTQQESRETQQELRETQQESRETQQESRETQQESRETQQESRETQQESRETQQESRETQQELGETQQESRETQQESRETQQESRETQQESRETRQEPSETRQEPSETQQEPSEIQQDLNETQTSTTETAASAQ